MPIKEDIGHLRKSYEKTILDESTVYSNPIQLFQKWFHEAKSEAIGEPNAMTLSTIGAEGFPKGRVVLLKSYDENGFVFYTNYGSEKGKAIAQNNKVSLSFFWQAQERQVLIKGIAEKVSEQHSKNYFSSRPRGSQLGALVSNQSEAIPHRQHLEQKLKALGEKYATQDVPKPANWGGYLVKPLAIEFWQGRPNRLHDRLLFTLEAGDWSIQRLAP